LHSVPTNNVIHVV